MATACFRFYATLNDFLPPERRQLSFCLRFERETTVKDMMESCGVPHTEVDLILINGDSVGFSQAVRDGDRVSSYPFFERLDISSLIRLRPPPLKVPRFVVDANLGRLARYLRLLGFDTRYRNDYDDATVAEVSCRETRIVLTRDRALLRRKAITYGYFVRANAPRQQLIEVVRRFDLSRLVQPFSRCSRCNGRLERVDKADVIDQLEPKTRRYYEDFLICRHCGQIYWRGSHYQRAMALVEEVVAAAGKP